MRIPRYIMAAMVSVMLLVAPVQRLNAVFPVSIVADYSDVLKWPRELAQWTSTITNIQHSVMMAKQMIEIIADPSILLDQLLDIVAGMGDPNDPLNNLFGGGDSVASLINAAQATWTLANTIDETIDAAEGLGDNYSAFGKNFKRDPKRYMKWLKLRYLYKRVEKTAEVYADISKREKKLRERIERRNTQSNLTDAAKQSAQIALQASELREREAKSKYDIAVNEYEMARGKLGWDTQMQEEALREEMETMYDERREAITERLDEMFGGVEGYSREAENALNEYAPDNSNSGSALPQGTPNS